MNWENVLAGLSFFPGGFGLAPPDFDQNALPVADQDAIIGYYFDLYSGADFASGSALAREVLDDGPGSTPLQIYHTINGDPGKAINGGNQVAFDLSVIDDTYIFNDKGDFVPIDPRLAIIHETFHAVWGTADLLGSASGGRPTEAEQNSSYFDFKGATVDLQNIVATQLGLTNQIESSYLTTIDTSSRYWDEVLPGFHYSEENHIDITIYGDFYVNHQYTGTTGFANDDEIDLASRTPQAGGVPWNDLVFGFQGNDAIYTGSGNDYLYGGVGNDLLSAGSGNNLIDGGDPSTDPDDDGIDVVSYQTGDMGQATSHGVTLTIDPASVAASDNFDGQVPIVVSDNGYGGTDRLISIEKIILSTHADYVRVGASGLSVLDHQLREIDAGGNDDVDSQGNPVGRDILDLTPIGKSFTFYNDHIVGYEAQFTGFEVLMADPGNDKVVLKGPDASSWQQVVFGDGNDTLDSSVVNLKVDFGNGNDSVRHAGAGSIINLGTGHDTVAISNDILVAGATANDVITTGDSQVEHGAVGSLNSESGWIVGPDGTRYGLDTQGDLEIKDAVGDITTVANYTGGFNVALTQQTAGIFVGRAQEDAFRLLEPKPDTPFNNISTTFEMGRALWFTESGLGGNQGSSGGTGGSSGGNGGDTGGSSGGTGGSSNGNQGSSAGAQDASAGVLVLDLDGSGIRLTAESGAAPMFDMFGTGFAVHTGWVQPSTGLLVMQNADGSISNISNLVGGNDNSGFAALTDYDANGDGVIDANDPIYSQLRIWQDSNGNAVVDPGELITLQQAGIASITVAATLQSGDTIAGNQITATSTFTRSDGSTDTIADASFATDAFDSQYLGDTTVSAAAAAMPNLKGYGTLTDLQVAMTLDPTLIDAVTANLSSLNQIDLGGLRTAAMPIFDAWARAVQLPDADGILQTIDPATGHSDVPILVATDGSGTAAVTDFAYTATDASGNTYWKLASGNAVIDASGNVIAEPTLAQVMAQTPTSGSWQTFTADEIGFMERYTGQSLPIDQAPTDPAAALQAMTPIITSAWNAMNVDAVELAMQGPLASYFQGVSYDAATDSFSPTTDQQLAPMYEAIFQAAPGDAAGAATWLAQWKPIVDVVLSNLDRGQDLAVSYAYVFASMVHAYETVGLPLDIVGAATALGVPSDMVITGGGTLAGNGSPDIFYLSGGDQTVNASAGDDNFVMGGQFGHDVINAVQGGTSIANALAPATGQTDILRFTNLTSGEVTASRSGEDLILKVNGADEQVTVTGQFIGNKPGLFGGDLNPVLGAGEIAFADGVVWDTTDIAWAVAPNTDGVDGSLIGTDAMDVLDGGRGNHFLSGGDGGDIYLYDRGDGADTIDVNKTNVLITNPNYVVFGPGLTSDDVTFSRVGTSGDLLVSVNDDPSDTLTIQGQFTAAFTGSFGTQYFNQIQVFKFADGTTYSWQDVQNMIIAQEVATPGATIYGFDSSDMIDPGQGAGDRVMSGGNGNDTYVFGEGYGHDTIFVNRDNPLGGMTDTVEFNPEVDPASVQVIRNGNSNDVELALADGSMLTIQGQFATAITGVFGNINFNAIADFQFQDDANTLWTAADIERMAIAYQATTAGSTVDGFSHSIYGFTGDDTIDPGVGGNAFMSGGDGNDTYVFGLGYGHDAILANQDSIFTSNIDTVLFNADVDPSTVTFTRGTDPNDLVITLADGSELDVQRQFDPMVAVSPLWFNRVDNFQFQDAANTLLTQADLQSIVLANEEAVPDSTINGFFNGSTLDGYAGNETLVGWDGANTYVFGLGYGHETVVSQDNDVLHDHDNVVQFAAGITAGMLVWSRSGNDLVVGITGTSDVLTLQNDLALLPTAVQQFTFADGTTWTRAQVEQMMIDQEIASGAATVVGFVDGTNTFTTGPADQTFEGEGGVNTYVYSSVAGDEVIDDGGNRSKLVFSDINSTDVSLATSATNGRDLVITDNATGKTVTVLGQFSLLQLGTLQSFSFADGVTWSAPEMRLLADADAVYAGTGDKTLAGRDRALDYVYSSAGGNDVIDDGTNLSKLTFLDIASSDVSLSRSGRSIDLVMTILSTGKTLTLKGQFSGIEAGTLQTVTFSDGVVWTPGQIDQMVLDQESAAVGGSVYGYANRTDTLVAGLGDKYLNALGDVGGIGTYVYSSAGGNDTIDDGGNHSNLVFADINPDDISLNWPTGTNDLVITVLSTGKTVTVHNQFSGIAAGTLQSFTFADGTVWTATQVAAMLEPLTSNYTFDKGEGHIAIHPGAATTITLGADIAASDVLLQSDSAGDLTVLLRDTGESLTVDGDLSGQSWGIASVIGTLAFGDGTTIALNRPWSTPFTFTWPGGAGNTTLAAGGPFGNNVFELGPNDVATGANGWTNTYEFAHGDGPVTINPGPGTNNNFIQMATGISASDVIFYDDAAGDLFIKLLSTGDTIDATNDLSGQSWGIASQMTALNFADGTSISLNRPWSTPFTFTWLGGAGNLTLNAPGLGNNLFELGPNDVVTGANGWVNTYDFSAGDGAITINPGTGTNASNIIQMGAGISASEIALEVDAAGDLKIDITGTSDSITLKGALTGFGLSSRIAGQINFADGTIWNLSQLASTGAPVTWLGTAGNDSMTLPANGTTIGAGRGDDYLSVQGSGSDTFLFAKGDGHDTIDNPGSGFDREDVLKLTDILPSEVALSASGNAMTINVLSTGDSITTLWQFWGDSHAGQNMGVSSIVFADGTVWNRDQIRAEAVIYGTSGNDSFGPPANGVTLDPRQGDDYVAFQGNGSDTLLFAKGDGHDVVDNPGSGYDREDTLKFLDVLPGDVALSRSGNALTISIPSTGDSVTAWWQFWGDTRPGQNQGISTIVFADGTTWNRDQIRNLTTWEASGSSSITGTSGNDVFDSGGTIQTIAGAGGSDTYLDRAGYGALTINNGTASGTAAAGELDFGSGISDSRLWFAQSGNALQIDLLGTTQTVTVPGWFGSNPSAALAEIKTDDGAKIDSGVAQLVSAMAAYSTNNPGFNPATATQMPTDTGLQSAIAASWHH
jgi:hypothetical protein